MIPGETRAKISPTRRCLHLSALRTQVGHCGTSEKRDDETIDLPVLSPAITDVRRTAKSRRAIANALRSQAPRSLSIRSFTSEGDLSHALYNQGTARLIPHL